MSDRSEDRKFPLRRLFGQGSIPLQEPCLRCAKPETNRVVLVLGDAGFHVRVLMDTGMDRETATTIIANRYVEGVLPMLEDVRKICADAGHPEWAEAKGQDDLHRPIPLAWRICRGCAEKADPPLATMNAERLNAILNEDAEGGMIPHVITQKQKS